ncbi:hypothetical protein [Salmon gill poxvirus]
MSSEIVTSDFFDKYIDNNYTDSSILVDNSPALPQLSVNDINPTTLDALVKYMNQETEEDNDNNSEKFSVFDDTENPEEDNDIDNVDDFDNEDHIVDDEIADDNMSKIVWDEIQTTSTLIKPAQNTIEKKKDMYDEYAFPQFIPKGYTKQDAVINKQRHVIVPETVLENLLETPDDTFDTSDNYLLNESDTMSISDTHQDTFDMVNLSHQTVDMTEPFTDHDRLKKLEEENKKLRQESKLELSANLGEFLAQMQIGTNTKTEKVGFIIKCSKTYSGKNIVLRQSDFDGCDMTTIDLIYKKLKKIQTDHQNKFYILMVLKMIFIGIGRVISMFGFVKMGEIIKNLEYESLFLGIDEECDELQEYVCNNMIPTSFKGYTPVKLSFKIMLHFAMTIFKLSMSM